MTTTDAVRKAAWGVLGTLTAAAVVWSFTWLTETRAMAVAAKTATDSVDITTSATHITLRKDFEHADAMIVSKVQSTNEKLEKTNEKLGVMEDRQLEMRDSLSRALTILERMERKL